jgi:hypothetical protein
LREAHEYVGAPRTSARERKLPKIFFNYMALMSELLEASQQQVWRDSMLEEYAFIMKNDVWEVVSQPKGKSMIRSRWIYRIKHTIDGSVEKFKYFFVANGFYQKEGIDYDETFSPMGRYTLIRAMILIATEVG